MNHHCNHLSNLSNAQASASEHDELSMALSKLSQSPNLHTFFLTGPIAISPDLYQIPPPNLPSAWLKLQDFHLTFNICATSGKWFFERDPNASLSDGEDDVESDPESEEESSQSSNSNASIEAHSFNERTHDRQTGRYPVSMFRTYPATEKIFALLKAFATATTHMPALRRASLKAGLPPSLAQFEVLFLKRVEIHSLDSAVEDIAVELVRRRPRLYFQTGGWRGEEDREEFDHVVELFRQQGMVHLSHENAHGEADGLLVKFFEW